MYFTHHKVESNQVFNGIPYIISEELLINPNNFITISGIKRATMVIWDKDKRNFTSPYELHNEETTEGMFGDTVIMELDIDQDPQAVLHNKMGNFNEADLQKSYTRAQGKDDETLTIENRSRQIGKKMQARKKTASPPGLNISPPEETSITSGLNQRKLLKMMMLP